MKKYLAIASLLLLTPAISFGASVVSAISVTPSLTVSPETVIQGEPVMVVVSGLNGTSSIQSLTFDGKNLPTFLYQSKPTAFIGIDIKKATGTYDVILKLKDGGQIKKTLTVEKRPLVEAPLGIPATLGGNTPAAQTALVKTLAKENAELATIFTGTKAFWTEKFAFPLPTIFVTDPYGYDRQTGAQSIAHKGTDFRAAKGTEVKAMNRGVVRVTKKFIDYGNTIVVDHGLGLMTFYMHLSKINVVPGQLVLPGQVIGLSGDTGYAEGPHLHITVRIGGVSIDPMKFMNFFN